MTPMISLIVYVSIGSITPGPNNVACMSNGIRLGLRKSLGYNFGVFAGYLVTNIICVAFGSTLYAIFPSVKPYIQAAGAAYLLWMAYKIWRSSSHTGGASDVPHTFWPSFFFQFVNPKAVFYSLTTAAMFISPYFTDVFMLGFLVFLCAFIGFAATLVWTVSGSVFQKFFVQHEKPLNAVMALLLVYCAISLFL